MSVHVGTLGYIQGGTPQGVERHDTARIHEPGRRSFLEQFLQSSVGPINVPGSFDVPGFARDFHVAREAMLFEKWARSMPMTM